MRSGGRREIGSPKWRRGEGRSGSGDEKKGFVADAEKEEEEEAENRFGM